jgi:small GTP-binding protein
MDLLLPAVPKDLLNAKPPKKLKVVLVGETNVGKSSYFERIRNRYINPRKAGSATPTIGMAYSNVLIKPNGSVMGDASYPGFEDIGEQIVGLWDTAGQEKFHSMLPLYLRGSDLIILMHEGNTRSKDRFLRLLDMLDEEIPNALVYMIQNKSDVPSSEFDQKFLDQVRERIIGWAHTSALAGSNIEESFVDAVNCYDRYRANNPLPESEYGFKGLNIKPTTLGEGSEMSWWRGWC